MPTRDEMIAKIYDAICVGCSIQAIMDYVYRKGGKAALNEKGILTFNKEKVKRDFGFVFIDEQSDECISFIYSLVVGQ